MKRTEDEDTSTWLSIDIRQTRKEIHKSEQNTAMSGAGTMWESWKDETVARPWYYFNDISALSSDYKGWGAILEASIWHEREATGDKESEELKMVLESKSSRFSHFQNNDRLAIEKTVKQDLKFLMNESEH